MKRTTVMLPDDVLSRLQHEARRRSTSVAEIVREAVEQHFAEPEPRKPLSFFAIGDGGPPDASERVDEFVNAAVLNKHPRPRP
jgi:hypothetical protein